MAGTPRFNVRFEVAVWAAPGTRRVLVNSDNLIYWAPAGIQSPRPDNIDGLMDIYAPGLALTLEAGPASLNLVNGRLTGEFGKDTTGEQNLSCSTRGTIITYIGIASPTLQLTATGRFGTSYFQLSHAVNAVLT